MNELKRTKQEVVVIAGDNFLNRLIKEVFLVYGSFTEFIKHCKSCDEQLD